MATESYEKWLKIHEDSIVKFDQDFPCRGWPRNSSCEQYPRQGPADPCRGAHARDLSVRNAIFQILNLFYLYLLGFS